MFDSIRNIDTKRIMTLLSSAAVLAILVVWVLTIQRGMNDPIREMKINIHTVEGANNLILDKEVFDMAMKATPVDIIKAPQRKIDVRLIESAVQKDSRIHTADVFIDSKKNLVIDIEQRRPILRIKDNEGGDYYLDQAGNYVAKSSFRAVRVPIITGYLEKYDERWRDRPDSRIKKAFIISEVLYHDKFLSALIEQIHFDKTDRIIMIPKVGNEKIVLDYMDNLEHKLKNLKSFYREIAETKNWNKYDEIDISYKNQVIGRNSVKP